MAYDPRKWAEQSINTRRRTPLLRWYLVFAIAISLAVPLVQTIGHGTGSIWAFTLALHPILAVTMSPFGRAIIVGTQRRAAFDEFERTAIYRATARAYWTLSAILLMGLFWMWIASEHGWPRPQAPLVWWDWAIALAAIAAALPTAFAEWMVPLPSPLDSREDDGEMI